MIGRNIQYLRKKHKLSQQSLSDDLGIPRTTLGDYEREKTEPGIEMLLKLSDYFKVSLEALLQKKLSHEEYEVARSPDLKVLAISVNQENEGNIELVDTRAEAGYLDSFNDPEYIKDLPKMQLPRLEQGTYRAFEISGDSMLPVEPGSIVICSYVENLRDLKDGKTYIIISKKDGLVYKRVKLDIQKKCLILISDNMFYLPYELALEDIDEIWQYYAHISFSDLQKKGEEKIEHQLSELNRKVSEIHDKVID